ASACVIAPSFARPLAANLQSLFIGNPVHSSRRDPDFWDVVENRHHAGYPIPNRRVRKIEIIRANEYIGTIKEGDRSIGFRSEARVVSHLQAGMPESAQARIKNDLVARLDSVINYKHFDFWQSPLNPGDALAQISIS